MTQQLESRPRSGDRIDWSMPPRRSTGRWSIVITMIVALLACGFTQDWASNWKDAHGGLHRATAERGALSGMNSYALALMLGGLRGPLVMVLWSKVENQKIDRDLEDIDTMIEWIRLLQPEFDTVHLFQIWNKAYNISVMMASSASKYTTILDAVDYARRVDADRPGDLNILDAISQVFADKLGGKAVTERAFYRKQFRQDSLTDANRDWAYPRDKGKPRLGVKFFDTRNGPLLDDHNNLDPRLLAAHYSRPADLPAGSEWNDGSELQYLARYQPFPYGIGPSAMGYNYAKRAQVTMTVGGQRPIQLSEQVIDSRPGLILKQWSEVEADRAVTFEAEGFAIPVDPEAQKLEGPTADIAPDQKPADLHALDAAIYSYATSASVSVDALAEYDRHLRNAQYVNQFQTYTSHLDEIKALEALSSADWAYLLSFLPDKARGELLRQGSPYTLRRAPSLVAGADRPALLRQSAGFYRHARALYELIILEYYTEEIVANPLYRSAHKDLRKLDDEQIHDLFGAAMKAVTALPQQADDLQDHRNDYNVYIQRCSTRLHALGYDQPSVLGRH